MRIIIYMPFTGVTEMRNSHFGKAFLLFMRMYNVKISYEETDDTIKLDELDIGV